jgi:6-phosphogluconolactonase
MIELIACNNEQDWIATALREILPQSSADFTIALSGGSTPAPVYRAMAASGFDWSDSKVFVVDERFVPSTSDDSNHKLIRKNFETSAQYYFWNTDAAASFAESAAEYETVLKKELINPLDVCILGIGPDGHTASLFPGSTALAEQNRITVATTTKQFAVRERLTMTFPVILAAKKIVILMRGASKKPMIDELLSGNKSVAEFPAIKLREHGNAVLVYGEF